MLLLIDERRIAVCRAPYDGPQRRNLLAGVVAERVFRGGEFELKVRVGEGILYSLVRPDESTRGLEVGHEVSVIIDPEGIRFLGESP